MVSCVDKIKTCTVCSDPACGCCACVPGCDYYCGLLDKVGVEYANVNRRIIVLAVGAWMLITIPAACVALSGLSSDKSVMMNTYWSKTTMGTGSVAIGGEVMKGGGTTYMNLWGLYFECHNANGVILVKNATETIYCNQSFSTPYDYDSFNSLNFISDEGKSCATFTAGQSMLVVGGFLGTIAPCIQSFCGLRHTVLSDYYTKCIVVLAFLFPCLMNMYTLLSFLNKCNVNHGRPGINHVWGPGWACAIWTTLANVPAMIMHLCIPAPEGTTRPDINDGQSEIELGESKSGAAPGQVADNVQSI